MGIYNPLAEHLMSRPDTVWEASFAEMERILGRKLPNSAYDHITWWGNRKDGNHGHANAWREAGWQTRQVDLSRKTVRFERVRAQRAATAGRDPGPIAELWHRASEISGISDRDALERDVLKTYIRRIAAKRLIELGGTMPDFEPAPRERPFG